MAQVRYAVLTLKILLYFTFIIAVCSQADNHSELVSTTVNKRSEKIVADTAATGIQKRPIPKPSRTVDDVDSEGQEDLSVRGVERTVKQDDGTSVGNASVKKADNGNKRDSVRDSSAPMAKLQNAKASTSLAGNLLLLLISVVIAGSLFVMLLCFVHKWRENMGTARYPRVVYSMLRQSEDEPEDVLGEILINIGLATPDDARPVTPTSSDTSETSPEMSDHEVDVNNFDGSKFTTIPLRSDEAARRLMAPECEESDEELLQ